MKRSKLKICVLLFSVYFISSTIISGNIDFVQGWELNATGVCTESEEQIAADMASTSDGGTIISWMDNRSLVDWDIYAQKLDQYGNIQWNVDGAAVCVEIGHQTYPRVCSDGSGGAIIVWQTFPEYDIYAQRIDSLGTIVWDQSGIVICNATENQWNLDMCSDDLGGAIIVWQDDRNAVSQRDIYAQRINQNGVTLWDDNGTVVCDATDDQSFPKLVVTYEGKIFFTWADSRLGASDMNIYAQLFNLTGHRHWPQNGWGVCSVAGIQNFPEIITAGNEAIVTWLDYRDDVLGDIWAQKIDRWGAIKWGLGVGTPICTAADSQSGVQLCSDMNLGAIITWSDKRSITDWDIFAQRINGTGDSQWVSNGTAICDSIFDQTSARPISDGASGAIIVWSDKRSNSYWNIYGQRVRSNGTDVWLGNGIAVDPSTTKDQFSHNLLLTGVGTAIVSWDDDRLGGKWDIWAQYLYDWESPTSNSPSDMILEEGEIGNIPWIISDNAGGGYYRVKKNGTNHIVWDDWDIGENLGVFINTSIPGTWEYIIEYVDSKGIWGNPDTVIITVTEKPKGDSPSISGFNLLFTISSILILIVIIKMRSRKRII